jgi:hypothetical protein
MFSSLLALLHCVQASVLTVPLLPAATAAASESGEGSKSSNAVAEEQPQQQLEQPILPARAFMQVIAVANTWLQDQPPAAGSSSSSSSSSSATEPVPMDHLQVLPLKDVALAAACMLGLDSSAAALKHITRASEALSDGFFDLSVLKQQDPSSAAAADASASGNAAGAAAAAASSSELVNSALGFKMLLESIALLQRCGQGTWLALPLQQLAASARGCSRQEMQQLIITRGKLLLQVLSDYLMHAPEGQKQQQQQQPKQQEQQQQEEEADGFEQQQEDAGSENAERCVLVAHVLIQMCPGRLAGTAGVLGSHGLVGKWVAVIAR